MQYSCTQYYSRVIQESRKAQKERQQFKNVNNCHDNWSVSFVYWPLLFLSGLLSFLHKTYLSHSFFPAFCSRSKCQIPEANLLKQNFDFPSMLKPQLGFPILPTFHTKFSHFEGQAFFAKYFQLVQSVNELIFLLSKYLASLSKL